MPARRDEIDSPEALSEYALEHRDLGRALLEGIDLAEARVDWDSVAVRGAVLVACAFPDSRLALDLQERGAVVVPALLDDERAYATYPPRLYSYEELRTIDARVEASVHGAGGGPNPDDPVEAIAQRLHDTAMNDATLELVESYGGRVVGIMGGHKVKRSAEEYWEVVRLAHDLAHLGYLVVTGGGPGVMEAGNLGAFLSTAPDRDEAIAAARSVLGPADSLDPRESYEAAAQEVHDRFAPGGESLAIPTWHYPNEPVGRFASHIAKYFANSIREDGLLQIADAGVVFARGGAGTLQEVFQNAAINAYAKSDAEQAPMVFLGSGFFGAETGIFDTLSRAAEAPATHRKYGHLLQLTDDVSAALAFIRNPPKPQGDPA